MNNAINLTDLANQLSNQDMCELIGRWADRIDVFIGSTDRMSLSGGLSKESPAGMNGPMIQINLEYTDDDGRDFMEVHGLQCNEEGDIE